jgi:5-methyltetrahydropteroyltriglutamate--homocysteine methyltransferase
MKTPRTSRLPRFYTHPIGSLPRPKAVLDLLARRQEMDPEHFRSAMDDAVRFAIRLQEIAGLDVVSDGEWRRTQYIDEFLDRIGGFEPCRRFEHAGEVKYTRVLVRRVAPRAPVFAADARFLAAATDRLAKFALPSPFLIAIRYWQADYSRGAYPTYQHLMQHLAGILASEAQALVEAGIDIVQIDDPALTYFCDRSLMAGEGTHDERLRRHWRPETQIPEAIDSINQVIQGLAAETHLHCCHSVYKRRSDVRGDYQPLLPYLQALQADRVNLEFAYHGTGGLSDLKLVPAHLAVGMGVVDVRGETPQSVEAIAALASAGAEIIAPERIALNPDCGFAPDSAEPPTIDEAFEKLKRLREAAALVRNRLASRGPSAPIGFLSEP